MDRLTFAHQIAQTFGLDTSLLEGVKTEELAQPAARPLAAGLATGKLLKQFPELRTRTLAQSLADCSAELREFLTRQKV
jgi:dTDP-4-dehydrorhamnose reductase